MGSFEFKVEPSTIQENINLLKQRSRNFAPGEAEMMGWDLLLKDWPKKVAKASAEITSNVVELITDNQTESLDLASESPIAV